MATERPDPTIGVTMTPIPVPLSEYEEFDGLPVVTHEGKLEIAGHTLRVFQLRNGQRIIPCEDLEAFFGLLGGDSP